MTGSVSQFVIVMQYKKLCGISGWVISIDGFPYSNNSFVSRS